LKIKIINFKFKKTALILKNKKFIKFVILVWAWMAILYIQ